MKSNRTRSVKASAQMSMASCPLVRNTRPAGNPIAAAARAGVSMQVYARDAIDAAAQEDEILGLAADALAGYGEAFGLDGAGNARKVAELRSRTRAVA